MEASSANCRLDRSSGNHQTPCPICGGDLFPVHSQMRCQRCRFLMCEGCENDLKDPELGSQTTEDA
jgi:hypothetical protein